MKKVMNCLIISTLLLFSTVVNAALPSAVNDKPLPSLSGMLEKVMPAVVNIVAQAPAPKLQLMPEHNPNDRNAKPNGPQSKQPQGQARPNRPRIGIGSGVIVDSKHGYILTNDHLVKGTKTIIVNLSDGRKFKAKLIGGDTLSDIAVIQIKADKLHAIRFANSDDSKVGDFVAAIGNPFGLKQTVTSGIISATQRSDLALEGPQNYENFIQTDASINPGNSGGALVDLKGRLIGINTAILAPSGGNIGIGFAIPSNMARSVMDQLIKHGSLQRGMVGVMVQNISDELARAFNIKGLFGAVVTQITPFSPAAKVDIRPGDIILAVNGKPIHSAAMVRNTIGLVRAGTSVKINVMRNGKRRSVEIKTEDPKQLEKTLHRNNRFFYGLGLQDASHIEPIQGRVTGVLIDHVMENSPAWHAGLMPGDVIISANLKPVKTAKELLNIEHQDRDEYLLINIRRGGGALFLPIKGYTGKE